MEVSYGLTERGRAVYESLETWLSRVLIGTRLPGVSMWIYAQVGACMHRCMHVACMRSYTGRPAPCRGAEVKLAVHHCVKAGCITARSLSP